MPACALGYEHSVTVVLPRPIRVQLQSGRRNTFRKLAGLFRKRIVVGDSLFDDNVETKSDQPGIALDFLRRSEGAQSVILDLVTPRGSASMGGTRVTGVTVEDDFVDLNTTSAKVCTLALHAQAYE